MSVYKASSWGRTRRPKQLYERLPTEGKQSATSVALVTGASLSADLTSTTAGQNGYSTENQRYLHVLVKTNNSKSLTIWGYNYAFAEWAPVYLSLGNAVMTKAVATTGSSGEAQLYVFEIAGIDRVAFVSGDGPDVVRAACSTF